MNDPGCLTAKQQEINNRLKGIETLVPGTIAPDIIMLDAENKSFELNGYNTEKEIYAPPVLVSRLQSLQRNGWKAISLVSTTGSSAKT